MKHLKILTSAGTAVTVAYQTSILVFEDFVELSTPINTTTDTDGSILDISTMGPPLTTSSPKKQTQTTGKK
jgi:hypothetical protein